MKPTRKRATRLLAFGPALVLMCVTAYVASGASVVGSASAVSTAGVTGTVSTAGSADPDVSSGTCAGETAVGGEALAANWETTLTMTNGCLLTFWTNNGNGATVNYVDDYGGTTFFCKDGAPGGAADATRICGTDNQNVDNEGGDHLIANGGDEFGIALTALSGPAVSGAHAAAVPVANPTTTDAVWWGVTNSARELCKTTSSNTSGTLANCTFKMGVSRERENQGAGSY